jgi:hypothetical protein
VKSKVRILGLYVITRYVLSCSKNEFKKKTPSKIQNGRHKQRSGQHTLARQKNIQQKTLVSQVRVHWGIGYVKSEVGILGFLYMSVLYSINEF